MFAVARIVGWSAHRLEELINMDKIIRPSYMSVSKNPGISRFRSDKNLAQTPPCDSYAQRGVFIAIVSLHGRLRRV